MRSATHKRLGAGAVNWRLTRSAGRWSGSAGMVVRRGLPRTTPQMPSWRMSRATRSRPTAMPSRASCRQIFSAPYTSKFSV